MGFYGVGMIMRHKRYDYECVIYGWNEYCAQSQVLLWAKIPPFSEGLWRRCRPRASKICPRAVRSRHEGRFWRPEDGIFSRVPRKKVVF